MNETIDKRAKQLGYRTELRTPIERPRPLLVALSGDTEERIVNRQIWGKLGLLMGHYGINAADPYGLMYLAEHLARDWVPGCMVENKIKRGAPIKITPMALTQLFLAIEQIRTEGPQQPLYEACKTFLSRNKTDPVWGKTPRGPWPTVIPKENNNSSSPRRPGRTALHYGPTLKSG